MNNNIKILLTIDLEGGTLVRKSECEAINWILTKKDLQPSKHFKGKEGIQVVKRGTTGHYSLQAKPASQHININVESYNFMISKECPYWSRMKEWNRMSKTARLEAHLQRICEHLNGKSFSYEILED